MLTSRVRLLFRHWSNQERRADAVVPVTVAGAEGRPHRRRSTVARVLAGVAVAGVAVAVLCAQWLPVAVTSAVLLVSFGLGLVALVLGMRAVGALAALERAGGPAAVGEIGSDPDGSHPG